MGAGGWEGAACVPTAQVSKLDSEGRTALRGWPGPPNAGSATAQALSGQWGPPPPALGLCPPPRAPAASGARKRAFSAHWDLSNIKAEKD